MLVSKHKLSRCYLKFNQQQRHVYYFNRHCLSCVLAAKKTVPYNETPQSCHRESTCHRLIKSITLCLERLGKMLYIIKTNAGHIEFTRNFPTQCNNLMIVGTKPVKYRGGYTQISIQNICFNTAVIQCPWTARGWTSGLFSLSSHPILSHLIPSYPIPSHPIQSHPILSYPILSYPISFHSITSHLISSHLIPYHTIPYHTILYHPWNKYIGVPNEQNSSIQKILILILSCSCYLDLIIIDGTVWYDMVWYHMVWYGMVWYHIVHIIYFVLSHFLSLQYSCEQRSCYHCGRRSATVSNRCFVE